MAQHIELERRFQELDPNVDAEDSAFQSYLAKSSGTSLGLDWNEIFQAKQSIVVLGEPGSGKTCELSSAARSLRERGSVAVFFDIVSMINASEPPLSVNDQSNLKKWRDGNSDAWLFLDAVDESKLSRTADFYAALNRIAAWVGSQGRSTRYVISSRITEWHHAVDKQKVEEAFEVSIKVLKLLPLTSEQVERLITVRDRNPRAFIEAIEAMDAWEFVGRPQDALDLHGMWAKSGRLGTKTEILKQATAVKLQLKNDHSGLAPERLREGAQHLSASLHLTKALSISLDEALDLGVESTVQLSQCLPPDWSDKERRSLIQRALFNDAAFGHVRLHHRTHQDYLAACWLRDLMEVDCPYPELRQLIFEDTGKGQLILRPFMKSVAAWLVCIAPQQKRWANSLLADIKQHAPWIFLADGDPQALSIDIRRDILRCLVDRFRDRTYVRINWDATTLKRFADPTLAPDISAWIADRSVSEDIRADFIMLVRQGGLLSSIQSIVDVAEDASASEYLRATALSCIDRVGLAEHRQAILRMARAAVSLSHRLGGWIAMCIYPSVADEHVLFTVLAKLVGGPKKLSMSSLDQFEREVVEDPDVIPLDRVENFLRELLVFSSDPAGKVRVDRAWTADWLEPTIARLISKPNLTAEAVDLVVTALRLLISAHKQQLTRDWSGQNKGRLTALSVNHPKLRRAWFWARYERARRKESSLPLRIFQIRDYYDLVAPHQNDLSWWLDDAFSSSMPVEHRCFALRAALDIRWMNASRTKRQIPISALITALRDAEIRPIILEEGMSILKMPWIKLQQRWKWKWSRGHYWRRKWQPFSERYWRTRNRIHFLLKRRCIASGDWWGACHHVIELARDNASDKSHSRWGGITSDDIDRQYGHIVGTAVRAGLYSHWRSYDPDLPHEKPERNQTAGKTIAGLVALDVAWNTEGKSYFASFSHEDVRRATRYALNELNGVPEWLAYLIKLHPSAVQQSFDNAIRAEWQTITLDGSDTLGRLSGVEGDMSPMVLPTVRALLEDRLPVNTRVLTQALRIVLQCEGGHVYDWLPAVARACLIDNTNTDANAWIWLTVLMQFDADAAFNIVKAWQSNAHSDAADIAVTFCAALANRRDRGVVTIQSDYRRPRFLLRLIPWVYEYVKPEDDPVHDGVYSPNARDDAMDFRRGLIELLVISDEPDAESILLQLVATPGLSEQTDQLRDALDRRRARLADHLCLKPSDLMDLLGQDNDRPPRSRSDLFHISLRRIMSFKQDVERAEISLRHEAAIGWKEKDYQRWIQRHLNSVKKDRYNLAAESEIDPGKFPDLRFEHPRIDGAISVEVKLADGRSHDSLQTDLRDQLVGQYLRAANANYGIYLLFHDGAQKHWHPTGRSPLDWHSLLLDLQETADHILEERLDIERLIVVGINVTKPAI